MAGYPQIPLQRGDVYQIKFKQTYDPNFPKGKDKYVLVLQSGAYFSKYLTVCVVLLTSEVPKRDYPTDVLLPAKTIPALTQDTIITCGQVWTVPRKDFENAPLVGRMPTDYMEKVNEALIVGLQIVDVLKP